jgi:hypothetical protein
MALLIANQDFSIEVAGLDVEVRRGDYWDSTTALAAAVAGQGLLTALPDGISNHTILNDWEG